MKLQAKIAMLLILAICATPLHAARKPNFGLYVENYQKVVGTNADFLEHPTGSYVAWNSQKWKFARELYDPQIDYTDDMDSTVMAMREKGYVMIGYAAFNSSEARDSPFHDGMTQGERTGTRLGLRMRGHDPNMDMKGNPRDAAIWANASVVVVQKGYAFSRLETKRQRIRTHSGTDDTRMRGRSNSRHGGQYAGNSSGSSSTSGSSKTSGNWDENGQKVGASAGTDGGSVDAEADWREGGSDESTKYNENSRFNSRYQGGYAGGSQNQYNDRITTRSEHWATTLVDKHVNHYDYMVTYWKKAKVEQFTFGAFTKNVPREIMQEIGTRHARMIEAVVGGTPAYDANVWEGDVLLEIAGEPVRGEDGYSDLLAAHRGEEVTMTFWRDGEIFDITVELNQPR